MFEWRCPGIKETEYNFFGICAFDCIDFIILGIIGVWRLEISYDIRRKTDVIKWTSKRLMSGKYFLY
jgi:hypothetical protein